MQQLATLMRRLLPWFLMAIILIALGAFPAAAQNTSTPRMLAVIGHGHDQAPTTLAQITLGISDQGDSARATYDKVNKRSATVVNLLKSSKANSIKDSNINLTPQYGRDGKPEKATYEGDRTIEFQIPVDKMEVLDKALTTGVDSLHSIRYIASADAINAARDQALKNAIADAQAQAKVVLDQLDFSPQDVVDIRLDNARVEDPEAQAVPSDDSYSSTRWSDNLPVESGEQAVDVSVTLKVRY